MPSSYTTSLRLTLPATGELSGQWGNTVNTGITELLDSAVAGTASISTWGGAGVAYTLSSTSGAADEARKMFIVASGSPGEAKNVICPAVSKFYVFRNDTTGGFALTLKTPSGTGISVPAGQYKFLYCDGTNVVEMFNSAGALSLSGNLTLSGGTANGVLYLNGSKVATSGSALTFDGSFLGLNRTVGWASELFGLSGSSASQRFIYARSTSAGHYLSLGTNGTAPYIEYGNGAGLIFQDGASEQMRLNSTGLGIGTSAPGAKLDVVGTIKATAAQGLLLNNSAGVYATIQYNGTSIGDIGTGNQVYSGGTTTDLGISARAGYRLVLGSNGVAQATLDSSGNLGIGTSSPGQKLSVNGGVNIVGAATLAAAQGAGLMSFESPIMRCYVGDGTGYSWAFSKRAASVTTDLMTLNDSGNLGLGVAPSAWSGIKSIQAGTAASFSGGSGFNDAFVASNAFYDGANWKYINTNPAYYASVGGSAAARWYTAPSGTAGNAITFTQAMTLDASGNLGVGTASPGARINAEGVGPVQAILRTTGASSYTSLRLYNDQNSSSRALELDYFGSTASGGERAEISTTGAYPLAFLTNNQERARITSGGDLLVGTTSTSAPSGGFVFSPGSQLASIGHVNGTSSGANYTAYYYNTTLIGGITQNGTTGVLYNTTSDRRLKDNIVPAPSASNVIDAIQIVSHDWKAAPDEHVTYGVIAQDLALVAPQAVLQGDDGDEIEKTWGVDYSKLVPMLIKELQSLRARVAALEAKP